MAMSMALLGFVSHKNGHDAVLYNVTASISSMHMGALVAYEVQKERKFAKLYSLPSSNAGI